MSKRVIKKAIASLFIFCIICFNLTAASFTSAESAQVFKSENSNLLSIKKTPSDLKDSILSDRNKTDRFIIKYKESSPLSAKAGTIQKNRLSSEEAKRVIKSDFKIKEGYSLSLSKSKTNDYSNSISLTLAESVSIDDFVIKELRMNPDILFIQPDYKLSISDLNEGSAEGRIYLENWTDIYQIFKNETDLLKETEAVIRADAEAEAEAEADADSDADSDAEIENSQDVQDALNSHEKVIVAIIDTGIDVTHEALREFMFLNDLEDFDNLDSDGNGFIDDVQGWNFVDNDNSVYDISLSDDQVHGTMIAGIIAGKAQGDYGISPDANVSILPIKAFSKGRAYTSDIIMAIQYADLMGAKVINCSFGNPDYNPALREAIEASSALFVCAVGNSRKDLGDNPVYPACFGLDNIISVASMNDDGGMSYFSNYSNKIVDVAAWGRNIKSTIPKGEYYSNTGTSMSAAFVSAAAARVLTQSESTADVLKQALIDGADKISPLAGYIKNAAKINLEDAISGYKKTIIDAIVAEDDFNWFGYSEVSEQYSLFTNSFDGGDGSPEYPYLISSASQMLLVNYNLGASYKLVNDIDLGYGMWLGIGMDTMPFTGTFDGGNRHVCNMAIYSYSSNLGLFCATENAVIKNLKLENAYIYGSDNVGPLAGQTNGGTITNCSYSGTSDIYGVYAVGGLVGYNSHTYINNCHTETDITGKLAGGLIGINDCGIVEKCYSVGSLFSNDYSNCLGGLVGMAIGETSLISICYSNAYFHAYYGQCGYLVGYALDSGSAIENCFTLGNGGYYNFLYLADDGVNITNCYTDDGIFVIEDYGAIITHSYYLANSHNLSGARTQIEMMQAATFENWDMVNVWNISEGESYPWLRDIENPYSVEQYALSAPTGLFCEILTDTKIKTTWDAVPGASSYEISINDSTIFSNSLSATFNNLLSNTVYIIKVRALDGVNCSDWSSQLNIKTKLNTPSINLAEKTDISIAISWSAIQGATSYNVSYNGTTVNVSNSTSKALNNLTPNTLYAIKVQALANSNNSDWSETISVRTAADVPVISTQPVGISTLYNSTALLSVIANSPDGGVLSYQWYSNSIPSLNNASIIIGATTSTYSAPTNLLNNVYYFVVIKNTLGSTFAEAISNIVLVEITGVASLALNCTIGEYCYIPVIAANYQNFQSEYYSITYPSNNLQLIDYAAQFYNSSSDPSAVYQSGIVFMSNSSGKLDFRFNKQIDQSKTWSGIITILKFKALTNGSCVVILNRLSV